VQGTVSHLCTLWVELWPPQSGSGDDCYTLPWTHAGERGRGQKEGGRCRHTMQGTLAIDGSWNTNLTCGDSNSGIKNVTPVAPAQQTRRAGPYSKVKLPDVVFFAHVVNE
jgi:hypothetical protein